MWPPKFCKKRANKQKIQMNKTGFKTDNDKIKPIIQTLVVAYGKH